MIRNIIQINILFFLFSFCFCAKAIASIQIEVSGNQRIETATIKSFFQNVDHDSKQSINKVLKRLHRTGIFSDIKVTKYQDELKIDVSENPLVNEIYFIGNKKLDSDILKQEITLAPRSIFTKEVLRRDVQRVTEIYKRSGRIEVEVKPKVKFLDENRIDVIFEINENSKVRVEKIFFIGNDAFSDKELKKVLLTKEPKWFRFGSSYYDPDKILYDKELLTRMYNNNGYANFKIEKTDVEFLPQQQNFYISFNLKEGDIYYFNEIKVKSENDLIDINKIFDEISIKQLDKFSFIELEKSKKNILSYLNKNSFAFVDVEYEIVLDHQLLLAEINFVIKNDRPVLIDEIVINGNTRTYDSVIRSRLKIFEGDSYNVSLIKQSKSRLENLGFFSKVNIRQEPAKRANAINLIIEVEEKPTGELNLGFGYSTTDKFLGNISIKERNLMGKAHTVMLDLQKSSISDQIDFSYKIPNFRDYNYNLGIELFDIAREYEESDANVNTSGLGFDISFNYSDHLAQTIGYDYKIDDIYDVSSSASIYIKEQEGKISTSQIIQGLSYNKLDNRFSPTQGYYIKYNSSLAGIGGDAKFFKQEFFATKYIPLYKKSIIFKAAFRAGQIEGYDSYDVRINNRFFLGGTSLRGFKAAGVGPRDEDNAALGGKYLFKSTLETILPIGLPEELGIKASVFTDTGTVFGLGQNYSTNVLDTKSLRLSVGFGIFWSSPLGPIRLDFGNAIVKETFDKTENFRISFGTTF
ncbi:MAG: outer membrane protein assembly factor BamA [Rickettsiales bacterium]|nr:outer membrane protein assembly factor BamA [Rickettsiales bacterium]